ncbi:unnamed protein product [Mytilus coruscus]|uniref:Uncharacterized protein n=1 Tax=Mytilus coruscus TaxID=42192 RepID=A0A6J8ECD4_MYTCO|nr:unnamed protein product [Mytilus coruscus]
MVTQRAISGFRNSCKHNSNKHRIGQLCIQRNKQSSLIMEKKEMRDFLGTTTHFNPAMNQINPDDAAKAKFKFKGAHYMGSNPEAAGVRTHQGSPKMQIFTQQFRRTRSESCGSEGEPASPIGSPITTPPLHAAIQANSQAQFGTQGQSIANSLKMKELRHEFDFK